jgi:hypothetical protein
VRFSCHFICIEYLPFAPTQQRWFQMTVTSSQAAMVRDQHLSHDRTWPKHLTQASRQRLDSIVSSAMDGIIDADVTSINPCS